MLGVVDILEALGVPYLVGGSLASEDALVYFASPEDTVLSKLDWYRRDGEVSDRQWGDVLAVLKVQGSALDIGYLRTWASRLDIADLLERALAEAGNGTD